MIHKTTVMLGEHIWY